MPVDEITIHPRDNDMLLATHGRSIWILDDVTPIQQAAEALKSPAFLFDIRPAAQFNASDDFAGYPGDRRFWGQNPEPGAAITYYLEDEPKEVRLAIRDAAGALVREMSGDDLKSVRRRGLNRTYWDLRHQPLEAPRGRPGGEGPAGSLPGPFVLPGEYRVTLTVDGREVGSRSVMVEGDRLIRISDADRKIHHDTVLALHQLQSTVNEATAAISTAQELVRGAQDLLKLAPTPPAGAEAADTLAKRLSALGRQLGAGGRPGGAGGEREGTSQPLRSQIASLKNQIMASTSVPTEQQAQLARVSRQRLSKLIAELNDVITAAIPALYKTVSDSRISPPPIKPVAPPDF